MSLDRLADAEQSLAPRGAMWGIETIRYGLIFTYAWFGAAKLWSPGGLELLDGLISLAGLPPIVVVLLGLWELAIAALFIHERTIRYAALMAVGHLGGTFLPLVLLPSLAWGSFPWLSLHGQFIIKNIVLAGGAAVVWAATVRRRAARRARQRR